MSLEWNSKLGNILVDCLNGVGFRTLGGFTFQLDDPYFQIMLVMALRMFSYPKNTKNKKYCFKECLIELLKVCVPFCGKKEMR